MAHGQQVKFVIMVSESNEVGKTYYKIGEEHKESTAYEVLRKYTKEHPEVASAYVERRVTLKNNKRKDWED